MGNTNWTQCVILKLKERKMTERLEREWLVGGYGKSWRRILSKYILQIFKILKELIAYCANENVSG